MFLRPDTPKGGQMLARTWSDTGLLWVALIHVDDIFVVCRKSYVMSKLVKCVERSYDISIQLVQKPSARMRKLVRWQTSAARVRALLFTGDQFRFF